MSVFRIPFWAKLWPEYHCRSQHNKESIIINAFPNPLSVLIRQRDMHCLRGFLKWRGQSRLTV